MSEALRLQWASSKAYRVVLVAALLYALFRLIVQGVYLAGMLPGQPDEYPVPIDLQVYLDAATHFRQRQDIYLQESLDFIEYHLPYPPAFVAAFVPYTWLPPRGVAVLHTLLHIVAYGLLYVWWWRMFGRLGLDQAQEMLVWTLPVWLVFAAFWSDLGYLNIYIILALLATLLLDAILSGRLGWSLLWLSIILQTKPMWAFPLFVPLILGRWRFLCKLLALAAALYVAVAGVTILIAGPGYGWGQYADYARLLPRLTRQFPWRGPDAPFLGYNHSIKQILIYLLGSLPETLRLATGIKALTLVPLAVVAVMHLTRQTSRTRQKIPHLSLDLAFAAYLAAFIWLDIVWEVSLGIAAFTYLLATCVRRGRRIWIWAVFLPYALVDFWQVAGVVAFGTDVVLPGPYVLTDPSIYVPLIMCVILVFYAVLVARLWRAVPVREPAGGRGWISRLFRAYP